MKKIKNEIHTLWIYSLFSSILLGTAGIFLFMNPSFVITFISFILGVFMIMAGIYSLIRYFHVEERTLYSVDLIYGVIGLLAGVLLIFNPEAVASILPLTLGVWMIIHSIIKLKYALSLKSFSSASPASIMIMALLTLLFGILFVLNPFRGATFLMQLLGITITLYAFIDLVGAFCLKRKIKDVGKDLK